MRILWKIIKGVFWLTVAALFLVLIGASGEAAPAVAPVIAGVFVLWVSRRWWYIPRRRGRVYRRSSPPSAELRPYEWHARNQNPDHNPDK